MTFRVVDALISKNSVKQALIILGSALILLIVLNRTRDNKKRKILKKIKNK